ncbi:MAG TPA: hypothetical protein PLE24_02455 [Chitinispirillaceae bacterium]|nr:hypothetical protein [Chitinispirillaceae bacterium]
MEKFTGERLKSISTSAFKRKIPISVIKKGERIVVIRSPFNIY